MLNLFFYFESKVSLDILENIFYKYVVVLYLLKISKQWDYEQ